MLRFVKYTIDTDMYRFINNYCDFITTVEYMFDLNIFAIIYLSIVSTGEKNEEFCNIIL